MLLVIFCLTIALCRRSDSVIVILCRNEDKDEIATTLSNFEDKFNAQHKYPYVFLNDSDWTQEFKDKIRTVTKSDITFGKVEPENWEMPKNIDVSKAKNNWKELAKNKVPYAELESYHNMCRFFSIQFYKHTLLEKYKYYWRIEPGVKFRCKITSDPFDLMNEKDYRYGFTITMREYMQSIKTLPDAVKEFKEKHENLIPKNIKTLRFMFDGDKYNGCHFWSNFEIGLLDFFRSKEYEKFAEVLESKGGFYYERWGDAPVHSLAVATLMDAKHVHFFENIGYTHPPFTHCPKNGVECDCKPEETFDNNPLSCLPMYLNENPGDIKHIS